MSIMTTVEVLSAEASVVMRGDLDASSTAELVDRIEDVLAAGCRHIALPAAGVTFLDAAALGVLLSMRDRLARVGCSLRLTVPSPIVLRVLTITHTLSLVE